MKEDLIMYELTQGSIITGIRSSRYPNEQCSGIIISARCDLANDKIEKIYYLCAVPFKQWIFSNNGFHVLIDSKINDLESNISCALSKKGLDWNTLKNFSEQEFLTVVSDPENNVAEKVKSNYKKYKSYSCENMSLCQKKEVFRNEVNLIKSSCSNIMSGKHSHYSYIPPLAFHKDGGSIESGLIIDHQELDFLTIETAKIIVTGKMDSESDDLSEQTKMEYNQRFFICDPPGFSIIDSSVDSPWIEYLLQRFSNFFTRIGVDLPKKETIKDIIETINKE